MLLILIKINKKATGWHIHCLYISDMYNETFVEKIIGGEPAK